jgi:single-strand DNA-binding protein
MFHQITIVGNLGRDPELRYTPAGIPVCDISVASTRTWTQGEEKKSETTWFRCTAWRNLGETINQYLHKGSKVFIQGRLNPDSNGGPRAYTKKDGTAGAAYELTIENIKFLDSRGATNGDTTSAEMQAPPDLPGDVQPF